jgi:predicted N-acyltransferase
MMRVERCFGVEQIGEAAWRTIEPPDFPFFDFEFLLALERSGSVGERSGWTPIYLVCRDDGGRLLGAMCVYLKTDSYGEYIFDWDWAHAYHEHGLSYYPKLTSAVPFTPATGPKLLVQEGIGGGERAKVWDALLDASRTLGDDLRVSSSHALFLPDREVPAFEERGFAIRHSLQFHWRNRGHEDFGEYLDALQSKRRRQISRERRQLESENLRIERLTGGSLRPEHAEITYELYMSTADRKWGMPYLNEPFFREVFETMKDRTLFVLASDGSGSPVAGALNFFKDGSLFGRYWGAFEDRRNLHFELCYYQAIEFAIERGMSLFEAGAQGEHKLARGFLPSTTYSAHEIRHPAFRRAIEEYIADERKMVSQNASIYGRHSPYKE